MYAEQLQQLCWGEIDIFSSRFQQANNRNWRLAANTEQWTRKDGEARKQLHER